MSLKQVFSLVYSDYRRYCASTGGSSASPLAVILLTQGFWASCLYRFSHAVTRIRPRIIRRPLRILFLLLEKGMEILTGIHLPGECIIGCGLYIGHFGNIIISDQVIMGENCNLSQGVTLGVSRRGDKVGAPRIGDRVYIAPNAVIFGGVEISNDCAIGAGAVVNQSFEARSVIVGNPARQVSLRGSFEFVRYDKMEQDAERQSALAARDAGKP